MRYTKYKQRTKHGLTLVEMLIVVAIVAILATMLIGIAGRVSTQGKEQLMKNTFALLNAALGQFRDYEYNYQDSDYTDFKFPLDCNDFPKGDLENELGKVLGADVSITNHDKPEHSQYSGSEALYFFLSKVPECKKTLDKIDRSREWVDEHNMRYTLITNLNNDGDHIEIEIDGRAQPLFRIIDPWCKTLRYSYYRNEYESLSSNEPDPPETRNFPVIISAGPDGDFGTSDDITSRD